MQRGDSRPDDGPLRVALITDTPLMSHWQATVVEALLSEPGVHISSHIHLGCAPRTRPGRRTPQPVPDIDKLPGPLTVHEVSHGTLDITADVAIDLSATRPLALSISLGVRVWSCWFGSDPRDDARRASYRSISSGRPLTRLALVEASPDGPQRIIQEGTVGTAHWSLPEQLAQLEDVARRWVLQAARRESSHRSRQYHFEASPKRPRARPAQVPCANVPVPATLRLTTAMRMGVAAGTALVRNETWAIGIMRAPITALVDPAEAAIEWLPLKPGMFAADPFGYEDQGTMHIFFEQVRQTEGRGRIAHVAVAPDGTVTPPRVVLEPAVHTSYPFLFRYDGRMFLLPETAAACDTVLYEATAPPLGWRPVARILPGERISDASVIYHADRWWLFATMGLPGRDHTLGVWHSARPSGPWVAHAENPVKIDVRSARPAGTPFVIDGALYRPAQDSAGSYGRRVALNRVDELTESRFHETTVRLMEADPDGLYPHGLHTVSACGKVTLVDGKRLGFVAGATGRRIADRLQSIRRRMSS